MRAFGCSWTVAPVGKEYPAPAPTFDAPISGRFALVLAAARLPHGVPAATTQIAVILIEPNHRTAPLVRVHEPLRRTTAAATHYPAVGGTIVRIILESSTALADDGYLQQTSSNRGLTKSSLTRRSDGNRRSLPSPTINHGGTPSRPGPGKRTPRAHPGLFGCGQFDGSSPSQTARLRCSTQDHQVAFSGFRF